jgi:hypothetical protein
MWARLIAYAAAAFLAACLWLLLGGSPAAADEGPSGLLGSVTRTVTEPSPTDPAGDLADRALRQVADVERRTTDTLREVAASTPVETVSPLVDRVTGTLDAVTTQAVDAGGGAVDQLGSLPGEPTTGPDPGESESLETGPTPSAAVLRADPAVRSTPPPQPAAHRVDAEPGTTVDSLRQPSWPLAAGPLAAARPFLDTTPVPAHGAPDGSTAGAGAPVVAAVAPTTTVRLPVTSSAPVARAPRTAPQQPAFLPGFAPD